MKKLLALVLVLLLAAACAVSASAVELDKETTEGTTVVKMSIDPTLDKYTVVIPESVTIDPITKSATAEVTLKAGCLLISADGLSVNLIDSANDTKEGNYSTFYLVNADGKKMQYEIRCQLGDNSTYNVRVLPQNLINHKRSTPAAETTEDKSNQLTFTVDTLGTAGEYTDTLTFGITLY